MSKSIALAIASVLAHLFFVAYTWWTGSAAVWKL